VTVTSYNGIGKELVIPERLGGKPVTEIADYAFMMHETIESVTIPDTLTRIGSGAFSNCEKLASVTLGRSVEYIGAAALSETAIKSIELPESLTDLGSSVFYNTPLESIKLPSKVKTVRAFCFSECRKLTRVDLGSVERIDNYAFDTCTALTEITLPATLLSIGDEAFGSCSSLATVIFLNPNTAYSDTAFNGTLFVPEQSGPSGVDGEGFTIVDLTMYAVEATNVRSRPSFDEDPTYWLKKEEAVRVIGIRDDGWAKIIIGETTLYVRYLQLSDKKADQLYQDAKDFIAKSDSLTVGISFSPTESNYGVDQNTIKTIGNSLQSESPAIKYVISEATVVIVDGMAYVVSSDGEKTKSTADASVFKSAFFSSDSYITHVFADFTEYTLDVEYSGKTLTLSGLPKEIFVYDAGSHMGVPNTQEFSDSITEYSYTLTFHFNSEGKLVKIVEEFSYTIGKTTMMSYMAVTFSETAENITVPEDADLYLPEESA